jgi:hypothetical protein
MTTTMERAATMPPAPGIHLGETAAACPDGVPWCVGDPDWHDDDESAHDSRSAILPTGTRPCTRHDEGFHPGATEVWLNIEREDIDGQPGEPHIYLAPHNAQRPHASAEEANLGLDEAEQLAYELLRLVALARSAKRAKDVRVGDVLVIDGVEQTAVIVLHDAECCCNPETGEHECDGSLAIQTDRCEDGEWTRTYDMDDLVQVRAEVAR